MNKFPEDFIWGTATSSYQIEGGWLEGGKGLSIWDGFAHTPGKIANGDTGDVSCDHYHRYREDVALMAQMGLKAYRFSISWPRIQPSGSGNANPEGIRFYSDLINTLLEHNITPWANLYHWELPLTLQLEQDGWLNPALADHFREYADICFSHFGDRVKHWITMNEPWVMAMLGYGQGIFPPGRVSKEEPYRAAHTLLRAHGMAADLYHSTYQHRQKGVIGIANNCDWREPLTSSEKDRQAAERALEFYLGWFADPLYKGEYPTAMRERVRDRLPQFSPDDIRRIKGSCDFFALNHYTTMYASHTGKGEKILNNIFANAGIAEDQDVTLSSDPSWAQTRMGWNVVPQGCRKLLHWIHDRYGAPDIVMTENGCAWDDTLVDGVVDDRERIEFLQAYIGACHTAIGEGVKLKGYFVWSFLDNFEWIFGFSRRFGLTYVDYASGKRIPKKSAGWFAEVIKRNGV